MVCGRNMRVFYTLHNFCHTDTARAGPGQGTGVEPLTDILGRAVDPGVPLLDQGGPTTTYLTYSIVSVRKTGLKMG